jgi:hypothetical protein
VANAPGIGGGVNAGTPVRFGGATASLEIHPLTEGEGGGFFDADDVVFDAQERVDFLFVLVVPEVDRRAVREGKDSLGGIEAVRQVR